MRTDQSPQQTPTRLADYQAPAWWVDRVHLTFDLAPKATVVRAEVAFRRNPDRPDGTFELHGRKLTLRGASVDGKPVEPDLTTEGLTLPGPLPDSFTWVCETEIDPATNTELEGLYLSNGMYCTQCEAEGFRKITYYPDRPDVMAPFTVRIEAPGDVPVLLSNGNPGASGPLADGRHFAEWHDPHPKPAYLFALVAGDLVSHDDHFTTASGAPVDLKVWVRPGDEHKCAYAMDSLIRSMRWDEQAYGREYDLDIFQIVAVDDFNMGAMENKGLNIFNSKYVLASPETATDRDYEMIESIVAHEYFHNWTGNRITCRDWFQLCLKEGLTVFRDQCFSADERSAPVQRIQDVKQLRARQFREDEGPLAHAVRPEEYVEINNFYTATVYEKGAEVIGMLHTLVGADGYRKALDLYFERHDGQACTIEQFRECFEDACGIDLGQFKLWWSQAGTPRVSVSDAWDGETLSLSLRQEVPATPGQPEKAPMVIPMAVGALGPNGDEIAPTEVLQLTRSEQHFHLSHQDGRWVWAEAEAPVANKDAVERPVLSINRNFAAPVLIERSVSDRERAFLLAHDPDPFNRWETGRTYAIDIAHSVMAGHPVPKAWIDGIASVLEDASLDPAFKALILDVPGEDELAGDIASRGQPVDPAPIHEAVTAMRRSLGAGLGELLTDLHDRMATPGPYSPDAASAGKRTLRNRAMALLAAASKEGLALAEERYRAADNMTDQIAALTAAVHFGAPSAAACLEDFYAQWKSDTLVLDKWLSLQAMNPQPGAVDRVQELTSHPAFSWKNPNKFRSVIGVFAMANPTGFHAADGSGYEFVADWLIKLDPVNPQTTARIAGVFETWRRYEAGRAARMKAAVERILATPDLSRNTTEILSRIVAD
ncbi:aminopeptidase N [Rhodobacteraceae bacterium NNCM2]|nr:aminopeptidase N [Coraliihabitans acroporae]